jgi:hypothetical protein
MASKKKDVVAVEPAAQQVDETTHEESFRAVRAWHEAAFDASAKEPKWRFDVDHAAREVERLMGVLAGDEGAILAWFAPGAEREVLAQSFKAVGPLARAAAFVERRAQRQEEGQQAMSGVQYREALARVRADRARLFRQAPLCVSMKLMGEQDWASIQRGNGPLDWARDVEDLAAVATEGWARLAAVQAVVFADESARIDAAWLKEAAVNARQLAAHIGRVDSGAADLKTVDWGKHARANRHLLKMHWERVCDAAEYHYKRSGQRALVKERCVPLGGLRKRG